MAEEKKEKKPVVLKVIIIAVISLLVFFISLGTAYIVANKVIKSSGGNNAVVVDDADIEKKPLYGKTINFGEYTLNLKEDQPRYLVVSIHFELKPSLDEDEIAKVQEKVDESKVILKDRLLSILMTKSINDLVNDADFVKLRGELSFEVNAVLGKEYVQNIRFDNWLVR